MQRRRSNALGGPGTAPLLYNRAIDIPLTHEQARVPQIYQAAAQKKTGAKDKAGALAELSGK